jgi:diketogulonate reductase-like aldo/keto reductase
MNDKEVSARLAGDIALGGKLSVHRLGFGSMRLTGEGIWGPPKDRKRALAVLQRAVELGVNFIDTADSYGPHVSEELIAEALFPYPKNLVIATKGGWNRPGPNQWTHDATPSHLRNAVEGSLKRLRLDRIDVYQLHIPDPVVSFDASVETLAQLRNEGKIRLVGLSNVTQEHIERARKIVPIVSVQNRYSFADREWDYVVSYCQSNGRSLQEPGQRYLRGACAVRLRDSVKRFPGNSACSQWEPRDKSNSMINDYSPQFPMRLMHKDLELILNAAAKEQVRMPATEAAFYVNSEELAGGDEEDFSAVLRRMEEVAGIANVLA